MKNARKVIATDPWRKLVPSWLLDSLKTLQEGLTDHARKVTATEFWQKLMPS